MGRPRRLDALTKPLSVRIRNDQDFWLRRLADEKFEGEVGPAVRWAIDRAEVFDRILSEKDPVGALDEMLNPPPDPVHPEEEVLEAEREFELWKREQAVKRAYRKGQEGK